MITLNETIIRGLVAQLQAHISTEVDAINSSVADGFTIQYPQQVLDYIPLPSQFGGGLPVVAVQDMPSTFEDDLVSSMTGNHMLGVCVILNNADPRALAWQLRRSMQAVVNVIQLDRTLGGACWTTILGQVEPGPMLGQRPGTADDYGWLSWTWLTISCRREEV